jgi:hypothetical protein
MLDGATVEVNHVLYRDPSNAVVRIRYRDIHSSNELGIDNLVMIRSETGWVLADGKTDSSASPPGGP